MHYVTYRYFWKVVFSHFRNYLIAYFCTVFKIYYAFFYHGFFFNASAFYEFGESVVWNCQCLIGWNHFLNQIISPITKPLSLLCWVMIIPRESERFAKTDLDLTFKIGFCWFILSGLYKSMWPSKTKFCLGFNLATLWSFVGVCWLILSGLVKSNSPKGPKVFWKGKHQNLKMFMKSSNLSVANLIRWSW